MTSDTSINNSISLGFTSGKRKTNADLQYVMLWLKQAEDDAHDARQCNSTTNALYLVQQSAEKSIKSLLLFRGKSYRAIRDIGHHSLKGYRSLILSILDEPDITPFVDNLLGVKSRKLLGQFDESIRDDAAYSKTRIWGPGRIRQLLQIAPSIKRMRNEKLEELQKHVHRPDSLVSYIEALPKISVEDAEFDTSQLTESLLSAKNLCRHRLEQAEAAVSLRTRDYLRIEVESKFEAAEAGLRLYVLAAITFSHANSLRYPARPGAPLDPLMAATCNKRDSFGIQHYSDKIGAIHHVSKLALEAEAVAKTFQTALPKNNESILLPPCEECM